MLSLPAFLISNIQIQGLVDFQTLADLVSIRSQRKTERRTIALAFIMIEKTTGILGILLLLCAYSAQYWVKKCYDELKAMKEELRRTATK